MLTFTSESTYVAGSVRQMATTTDADFDLLLALADEADGNPINDSQSKSAEPASEDGLIKASDGEEEEDDEEDHLLWSLAEAASEPKQERVRKAAAGNVLPHTWNYTLNL